MKRSMMYFVGCIVCLFLFLMSNNMALASPLVYTPINPSFGGSSFNGGWLLSSAQAQNKFREPVKKWTMPETDPIADFKKTLNRQLLYSLSRKIIDAAFGEEGFESGHYNLEDYTIDVSSGLDGIKVILTDSLTGNQTTIEVPYY